MPLARLFVARRAVHRKKPRSSTSGRKLTRIDNHGVPDEAVAVITTWWSWSTWVRLVVPSAVGTWLVKSPPAVSVPVTAPAESIETCLTWLASTAATNWV